MSQVLITNAKTICKGYINSVKRANKQLGVHIKRIKKINKNGEERVYEYYYRSVPRSKSEIERLVLEGHDPRAKRTRYWEEIIGKELPTNYLQDEISLLMEAKLLAYEGDNVLVKNSEAWDVLRRAVGHLFVREDIKIYQLEGEI